MSSTTVHYYHHYYLTSAASSDGTFAAYAGNPTKAFTQSASSVPALNAYPLPTPTPTATSLPSYVGVLGTEYVANEAIQALRVDCRMPDMSQLAVPRYARLVPLTTDLSYHGIEELAFEWRQSTHGSVQIGPVSVRLATRNNPFDSGDWTKDFSRASKESSPYTKFWTGSHEKFNTVKLISSHQAELRICTDLTDCAGTTTVVRVNGGACGRGGEEAHASRVVAMNAKTGDMRIEVHMRAADASTDPFVKVLLYDAPYHNATSQTGGTDGNLWATTGRDTQENTNRERFLSYLKKGWATSYTHEASSQCTRCSARCSHWCPSNSENLFANAVPSEVADMAQLSLSVEVPFGAPASDAHLLGGNVLTESSQLPGGGLSSLVHGGVKYEVKLGGQKVLAGSALLQHYSTDSLTALQRGSESSLTPYTIVPIEIIAYVNNSDASAAAMAATGRSGAGTGDAYFDGGTVGSYEVWLFDNHLIQYASWMPECQFPSAALSEGSVMAPTLYAIAPPMGNSFLNHASTSDAFLYPVMDSNNRISYTLYGAVPRYKDYFGAKFVGQILIETAAMYTFQLSSDDSSRLTIGGACKEAVQSLGRTGARDCTEGGTQVVNNGGCHGMTPPKQSAAIALQQGWLTFQIDYFEKTGNGGIEMTLNNQIVPSSRIRTVPATSSFTNLGRCSYYQRWTSLPSGSTSLMAGPAPTAVASLVECALLCRETVACRAYYYRPSATANPSGAGACTLTENDLAKTVASWVQQRSWPSVLGVCHPVPATRGRRLTETPLSGGNDANAKNLKACTGECDSDAHCGPGLECFQREKGEKIPGCSGKGGGINWDYCYDPIAAPTGEANVSPVDKGTSPPVAGGMSSFPPFSLFVDGAVPTVTGRPFKLEGAAPASITVGGAGGGGVSSAVKFSSSGCACAVGQPLVDSIVTRVIDPGKPSGAGYEQNKETLFSQKCKTVPPCPQAEDTISQALLVRGCPGGFEANLLRNLCVKCRADLFRAAGPGLDRCMSCTSVDDGSTDTSVVTFTKESVVYAKPNADRTGCDLTGCAAGYERTLETNNAIIAAGGQAYSNGFVCTLCPVGKFRSYDNEKDLLASQCQVCAPAVTLAGVGYYDQLFEVRYSEWQALKAGGSWDVKREASGHAVLGWKREDLETSTAKLQPNAARTACGLYSCPAGSRATMPSIPDHGSSVSSNEVPEQGCFLCPGRTYSPSRFFVVPLNGTAAKKCLDCVFPYASTGGTNKGGSPGGYTKCEFSRPFIIGLSTGIASLILFVVCLNVCKKMKRARAVKSAAELSRLVGAARQQQARSMKPKARPAVGLMAGGSVDGGGLELQPMGASGRNLQSARFSGIQAHDNPLASPEAKEGARNSGFEKSWVAMGDGDAATRQTSWNQAGVGNLFGAAPTGYEAGGAGDDDDGPMDFPREDSWGMAGFSQVRVCVCVCVCFLRCAYLSRPPTLQLLNASTLNVVCIQQIQSLTYPPHHPMPISPPFACYRSVPHLPSRAGRGSARKHSRPAHPSSGRECC